MKRYHVSENKFDKSTATLNKRVTTSGTIDYTGAFASDYIPISENVNCTITGLITTVVSVIYFYDSSNTNIGYISADSASSYSFITPNGTAKLRFTGDMNYINTASVITYTWQTKSPLKYGSATETIQSGDTIYADGTAITAYTLKGNTVQNGTPTPSNPVAVNGVGERTANLLEYKRAGYNLGTNGYLVQTNDYDMWFAPVTAGQTYVAQNVSGTYGFYTSKPPERDPVTYDGSRVTFSGTQPVITVPQAVSYIGIRTVAGTTNAMLNDGSTVLPYEPLGYKIPISSGQTALNPIYLTGQLMAVESADTLSSSGTVTYQYKKYEIKGTEDTISGYTNSAGKLGFQYERLDMVSNSRTNGVCSHFVPIQSISWTTTNSICFGANNKAIYFIFSDAMATQYNLTDITSIKQWLADQYAAGTPVTIVYPLETATTESVTAPEIPTTDGANSITVDTTVQPSEFTATWTGWHNAEVKEKSENLVSMSEPQGDGYIANTILKENDTTATSNSFFVTEYIPVTGGATYYYYTRLYRSSTSYIVFYDSSKNYISEVLHKRVMEDEEFNLTSIAIPSNASYLRMCIDKQSTQNCLYTSQLPAYVPYWE